MTCENCNKETTSLVINGKSLFCWPCHNETKGNTTLAPSIIPDSFVGGLYIKHGLCHEDGTPKRYESRSEVRRAAFEAGLTWANDTPHPNQRIVETDAAAREKRNGR